MTTNFRKRRRDRDVDDTDQNYEEIPKEFFCPISTKFMSDPVRIPKSHITYDRDSVKDMQKPEDVQPDLRMRNIIEEWFSHYDLDPPFDFMSNQDDLIVAADSVIKQCKGPLLREFTRAIRSKPWLLKNGGCIQCVATLLSCPRPPADWVAMTVSIVARVDDDVELVVPNTGIHPEYTFLDSIKKALDSDSDLSDNKEFKIGLVMLMHGLAMNSPDIAASMAGKLERIIIALVSYMWPVPEYLISGWFQKLLKTVKRLSEIEENCQHMFDARIIFMLSGVLETGVSYLQEMEDDADNVWAREAIETIVKTFDSLCQRSQGAREEMKSFFKLNIDMFRRALFNYVESTEASVAGARVLAHIMAESGNGFSINTEHL